MCGVFGLIVGKNNELGNAEVLSVVRELAKRSESRGKEATGLAWLGPQSTKVVKSDMSAGRLVSDRKFLNLPWDNLSGSWGAVLGHSRLVTSGHQSNFENNQPLVAGRILGTHNGIITNEGEIEAKHLEGFIRKTQNDSEVFFAFIDKICAREDSVSSALEEASKHLQGTISTAFTVLSEPRVYLHSNHGSLHVAFSSQAVIYASEQYILERIIEKSLTRWGFGQLYQLKADELLVSSEDELHRLYKLSEEQLAPAPATTNEVETIIIGSRKPQSSKIPQHNWKEMEKHLIHPPLKLQRCSKCILPITMPFIDFDEEGVCNFCRNHKGHEPIGEEALRKVAEEIKTPKGANGNVIVALSGGRDSCYGLHYLKRELGLRPIAFTYDWGMVTDLARRNQARLCGALEVEHIWVSADIAKKRRNIRLNVEAWLKQPRLGIVPLFMAGDKQFFHYAAVMRKQLGIDLLFFCGNRLEKTNFKSGFCGVNEGYSKRYYDLSFAKKIKMLSYYLGCVATNPGYINRSVPDTIWSFGSTYVYRPPYEILFHYIDWDEEKIVNTIIQEYDWETAPDTNATWRIGDGTAPFYNYIYNSLAGFSETDTFLSNLIREQKIDRQTALERAKDENEVRLESLTWYFDTIGVNTLEALKAIEKAPRLYENPRHRGGVLSKLLYGNRESLNKG